MFPSTPETHPSRQVERIREILVGRQMESVERRLEKLEMRLSPLPVAGSDDVFSIRLGLERHQRELQELRQEVDAGRLRHQEDLHRLAGQIQAIARSRSPEPQEAAAAAAAATSLDPAALNGLETRLSHWLQTWQTGFTGYHQQREDWLITSFRGELERMREWVRQEVTQEIGNYDRHHARERQALQGNIARMAAAARELAEAATATATAQIQVQSQFSGTQIPGQAHSPMPSQTQAQAQAQALQSQPGARRAATLEPLPAAPAPATLASAARVNGADPEILAEPTDSRLPAAP